MNAGMRAGVTPADVGCLTEFSRVGSDVERLAAGHRGVDSAGKLCSLKPASPIFVWPVMSHGGALRSNQSSAHGK